MKSSRFVTLGFMVLMLLTLSPARFAHALPGDLDTSFDTDGKVTTDFLLNGFSRAFAMAIQTDGKIVVAGEELRTTVGSFALARYNSNGSLDTTFGTGGRAETIFPGNIDASAHGIAIQGGGIVVVGRARSFFGVARYINGTLDTGFSGDGLVTTDSEVSPRIYTHCVCSKHRAGIR
jgi:uncharacterized delta-60 repeat protein